jgi:hypothetical protein
MYSNICNLLLLAGVASAAAIYPRDQTAASIILKMVPESASCASSSTDCRTNVQAAPYLIKGFQDYGITSVYEIAAVLSLIAFESGNFVYNVNVSPGRPGQGCRNMMEWESGMTDYINSIPTLQTQLAAISSAPYAQWTSDQMNAGRALVLPDEYTWAAGAWWLINKCPSARPLLQAGKMSGWDAYMACDGESGTDSARLAYLTAAETAFGITFS